MRISLRWKWMGTHFLTGLIVLLFMYFYLSSRLKNYFQDRFEELVRDLRHMDSPLAARFIRESGYFRFTCSN